MGARSARAVGARGLDSLGNAALVAARVCALSPLPPSHAARRGALAFLAALLGVGAVYRFVPSLAMLGWDGWPLVAAARFDGAAALVRPFGEELMAGRYPYGHFYRPLVHLSFGLDHLLWGLDPAGYQRTDLAWLAAATAAVGLLAARVAPVRATLAGVVAASLFALHPVQLEIVPMPPRRADSMALAFTLWTLLALPRGPGGIRRRRAVGLALVAFAAGASKETGVLAAPLATAAALWVWPEGSSSGPGLRSRLASALRRSAPAWIGVALYVASRGIVLGGLGGHEGGVPSSLGARWGELVAGALGTGTWLEALPRGATGALGALVILVAALAWPRRDAGGRTFLLVWIAGVLGITSFAERAHEWYAVLLVVPLALLLGGATAGAAEPLAARARGRSALAALAVLGLAACWLGASPLVRRPRELLAASRLARAMLAGVEEALGSDPPAGGVVARVDPWIPILPPSSDGRGPRALHLADAYTLRAWCELRWPGRRFVVALDRLPRPEPPADGILVLLAPGPEPEWVRSDR